MQVCANAVVKIWADSLAKVTASDGNAQACANATGIALATASQVTRAMSTAIAFATTPCASAAAYVNSTAFAEAITGEIPCRQLRRPAMQCPTEMQLCKTIARMRGDRRCHRQEYVTGVRHRRLLGPHKSLDPGNSHGASHGLRLRKGVDPGPGQVMRLQELRLPTPSQVSVPACNVGAHAHSG